ncbi:MAG: hypothetical protein ACRDV4_02020, partial [Acidimicrobiales bacterium]
ADASASPAPASSPKPAQPKPSGSTSSKGSAGPSGGGIPSSAVQWYESFASQVVSSITNDESTCYVSPAPQSGPVSSAVTEVTEETARSTACEQMMTAAQNALSGPGVPVSEGETHWVSYLNDEIWVARDSAASIQQGSVSLASDAASDQWQADSNLAALKAELGVAQ